MDGVSAFAQIESVDRSTKNSDSITSDLLGTAPPTRCMPQYMTIRTALSIQTPSNGEEELRRRSDLPRRAVQISPMTSTPAFIAPPEQAQVGRTLIQIGFSYELNYAFVVDHASASWQIFEILPWGLAFGLDIIRDDVTMQSLQPYDTNLTQGYITTVALAYIPSELVANLIAFVPDQSSALYKNTNATRQRLMSVVDPNFPVLPGSGANANSSAATNTLSDGFMPVAISSTEIAASIPTQISTSSQSSPGPSSDANALQVSKGALAGIVVGPLVAVILALWVAIRFAVRRRRGAANMGQEADGAFPVLTQWKGPDTDEQSELNAVVTETPIEKDGLLRSEAPGIPPGPGYHSGLAVGGTGQGFASEMPDTSRHSLRSVAEDGSIGR